jgi:hypothetical protein
MTGVVAKAKMGVMRRRAVRVILRIKFVLLSIEMGSSD